MNDSASTQNPFMSYSGQPSSANFIPVVPITASATLNASQSGSIVSVTTAASLVTLTLPAPQAGLNYKIVKADTGVGVLTITATGAILNGSCLSNGTVNAVGAKNLYVIKAQTSILTTAVDMAGSWVDLTCDGTNWYVLGVSTYSAVNTNSAWGSA